MIFCPIGTSTYQFPRLVELIIELSKTLDYDIVCQHGYTDPGDDTGNLKFLDFLSHTDYKDYVVRSEYIIAHCGIGVTMDSLKGSKKLISVPRCPDIGEHCDDHQMELAALLEQKKRAVVIWPTEKLQKKIFSKRNI